MPAPRPAGTWRAARANATTRIRGTVLAGNAARLLRGRAGRVRQDVAGTKTGTGTRTRTRTRRPRARSARFLGPRRSRRLSRSRSLSRAWGGCRRRSPAVTKRSRCPAPGQPGNGERQAVISGSAGVASPLTRARSHRPPPESPSSPHGTLNFPGRVPLGQVLSLIVCPFTAGKCELHLDFAVFEIKRQRDQR